MCGRFTLRTSADVLMQIFQTPSFPQLQPRWNIAPTQQIVALLAATPTVFPFQVASFRWGLVPFWADSPAIGSRMLNARSETAAEKPAFRAAFRKRRCLIPADGFYEWQTLSNGKKQPWWIHQPDEQPFAMAGLWESWTPGGKQAAPDPADPATEPLRTCTVLTTSASSDLQGLHDRMPVILPPALWPVWLNPETPITALQNLLQPASPGTLLLTCVSTLVNRPSPDSPDCITPIAAPEPLPGAGQPHL
jgi:putative SOS response-associated peptidase YedK